VALTDSSDLYGSFHEHGVNRIIRHVMEKRPSLFNYGTSWVAQDWRERMCCAIEVAPEVISRNNPVVTVEQALPIPGTGGVYGLNWGLQIAALTIDFHPTDRRLPAELGEKLAEQQLSLFVNVCAGIGCPGERGFRDFPPAPQPPFEIPGADNRPGPDDRPDSKLPDPITLPAEQLACFHLDLYATAHAEVKGPEGAQTVELVLDGVEIVDIEPAGLERSLECYLEAMLRYVVMPRLRILLPVFVFDLPLGLGSVTVKAATTPPHNPAVEQDELRVFVDMKVAP
jgi:hypothetical protein